MTPEIFKHSLRRFAQGAHSFHHKTSQPTHSMYTCVCMITKYWSQHAPEDLDDYFHVRCATPFTIFTAAAT